MSTSSSASGSSLSRNQRKRRARFQATGVKIPPLIAIVLADELYYGDGPPIWPGAPTSNDAKKARKRYIKRLKRASPQFPDAKALADTLAECKPGRRCMSGACPECARAFQRFFVAEVSNLAGNLNQDTLTSVSVIFQEHRKPEDQLQALS
jgi:hypothetical protein